MVQTAVCCAQVVICDLILTSLGKGQGRHRHTQVPESTATLRGWDRGLSVHHMGVSRLDPQHPSLRLWDMSRWGGSAAYSFLLHCVHTTFLEGELHGAAKGLAP